MQGKRSVEKGRMHMRERTASRSDGNLSRHTRRDAQSEYQVQSKAYLQTNRHQQHFRDPLTYDTEQGWQTVFQDPRVH